MRSVRAALTFLLLAVAADAWAADSTAEGWKLFLAGKYAEAAATAREQLEGGGNELEWRVLLVRSLAEEGQLPAARSEANTLLTRHGQSLRALWTVQEVRRQAGDRPGARELLARIQAQATGRRLTEAPDLVAAGLAALRLGADPKAVLAHQFAAAAKKDPRWRETYVHAGRLALDKHDDALAAEWFRRGGKAVGADPDLLHGLARSFQDGDRRELLKHVDAALKVNPRHAPSLLLRAEHEIDSENYAGARVTLARLLAVDRGQPLGRALMAVVEHLQNDAAAEVSQRQQALARAPDPEVDTLIGRKLSEKYRFTEGAAYQRRALKTDPTHLPAKIRLAQDLLRLGDHNEGWALAEEVHKHDRYDVEAYNLVELKGRLAKLATLREPGFTLRMDPRESEIYGADLLALLRTARATLDARYGWKPTRATQVEVFREQADFAVRTFGLPGGGGYLGVCFGNVITANSPAGAAGAVFNWKAVLWHEYTHVVTLGLTRNKMPRWLAEGISVWEETRRDPTWGQRMTSRYREMIRGGELTPVSKLSGVFLDPKTPEHVTFAYFQSALVVEFLVERYGFEALKAILRDLGEGTEANAAVVARTAPLLELEKAFEAFAKKKAEAVAPDTKALLAQAEQARQRGEAAKERALLEQATSTTADLLPAYMRLLELGGDVRHAEAAAAVNPMAPAVQRALGRAYEKNSSEKAVLAYRRLLKLEPDDPADVHFRLATLLKGKDRAQARRHVLDALAEAPRFRPAHKLLLELKP